MTKLYTKYKDDSRVKFVAIQTVFADAKRNTVEKADNIIKTRLKMDIPIGMSGTGNNDCQVMNQYQCGGTPCSFIIDSYGRAKFKFYGGSAIASDPEGDKTFIAEFTEVIDKLAERAKADPDQPPARDEVTKKAVTRTLTNTAGKTLDAELISLDGDQLKISSNGREFTLKLDQLSQEDQEYIKKWAEGSE